MTIKTYWRSAGRQETVMQQVQLSVSSSNMLWPLTSRGCSSSGLCTNNLSASTAITDTALKQPVPCMSAVLLDAPTASAAAAAAAFKKPAAWGPAAAVKVAGPKCIRKVVVAADVC